MDAASKQGAVPDLDVIALKKRLFESILASESESLSAIPDTLTKIGKEVAALS